MEEVPSTPTLVTSALTPPISAPTPLTNTTVTFPPPPLPPPLSQAAQPERDARRSGGVGGGGTAGSGANGGGRLGLTKEVLSAHTQQEEQAFLDRFKDLSKLRVFDQTASSAAHCRTPAANPLSRGRGTNTRSVQDSRVLIPHSVLHQSRRVYYHFSFGQLYGLVVRLFCSRTEHRHIKNYAVEDELYII